MNRNTLKTAAFWLILLSIPVLFCALVFVGWYAYGMLRFNAFFCGTFAQLDPIVGWVLKPNAQSCMGVHVPFHPSDVYYRFPVYTDRNGFRSEAAGEDTPKHAVMAIGDSQTFGYMVSFADSYPGHLRTIQDRPVINMGDPGYSGAQAILLARRWISRLEPVAIVYWETGFWERGVCKGDTRPKRILKPCYWVRPDGGAELIAPPQGYVRERAAWGMRPGGMLGAGELTWSYFLVSRPISKLHQMMVRVGLANGMPDDFRVVGVDGRPARRALLHDLATLGREAHAPVVLLDSFGLYRDFLPTLSRDEAKYVYYVGKETWDSAVETPSSKLPPDRQRVPHDGHYGGGAQHLIAELVKSELAKRRSLRE
jgi:hypothetical protein